MPGVGGWNSHADHAAAMAGLPEAFPVARVCDSGPPSQSRLLRAYGPVAPISRSQGGIGGTAAPQGPGPRPGID